MMLHLKILSRYCPSLSFSSSLQTIRQSSSSIRIYQPNITATGISLKWPQTQLPLFPYNQYFKSYSSSAATSNKKDLYSRLGLTPKATQAQIKDAYYKLSMKYHPDRNHGNQTAADDRFREITEAYSVLGNNLMRRKYDRGLLREYPSPRSSFSSTTTTTTTGTSTGKGTAPKYDFDAFYAAHYGEALKREQKAKAKRAQQRETKTRALTDVQQQLLIITVIALVLLCGWHYGWGLYSKQLKKQTLINSQK